MTNFKNFKGNCEQILVISLLTCCSNLVSAQTQEANSNLLIEGVEYKCFLLGMRRINGNKIDEIAVPANAKPIYISLRNSLLSAKYKNQPGAEVAYDNSRLIKNEIVQEQQKKFAVSSFSKTLKDGEASSQIFKEINGKDLSLTLSSTTRFTGIPGALMNMHRCDKE